MTAFPQNSCHPILYQDHGNRSELVGSPFQSVLIRRLGEAKSSLSESTALTLICPTEKVKREALFFPP